MTKDTERRLKAATRRWEWEDRRAERVVHRKQSAKRHCLPVKDFAVVALLFLIVIAFTAS